MTFIIEHLEDFLSNVFFLIDQKQKFVHKEKFEKYFQQPLKQLEKKSMFPIKSIEQNFNDNYQNVFQLKNNLKIFNSSKFDQIKIFSSNLSKQKLFLTILFQQFSFEIILQNQKIFFFSFTNLFKTFCIFILFIFNHKSQNSFSFTFKYLIKTLFLFKSPTISLLLSKQISFSHSFKSNFRCFSLEQLFIPNLNINQIWKQDATTIAGGHRDGNGLNQLSYP
jgi:hypothetical protein